MTQLGLRWIRFAVERPRLVVRTMVGLTLALALLAGLPSLFPGSFGPLHGATVDTDPENMLSADEPVRVFHHRSKKLFNLHDGIVLGVVNETHPDGVFNPSTLAKVHTLTNFAKTLDGVVEIDVMSLSTVDYIANDGPGTVRFDWLMAEPPTTAEEARAIRDRVMRIPFLRGTLVSEDGRAVAIYIPLERKDVAHEVSVALQDLIDEIGAGEDDFHLAGLPIAEDTFGVEMFKQMAISAPVAMLVIFLLLWVFFRKLTVIASPMIVAMVAAISTVSLLVITGNTIHIMSSMIPIFIMPIAVLDAVHIISDFFERYREDEDRAETVVSVMGHLFKPMLYTSLTTTAGFASLALTPIPPVRVFGVFVAFGVMAAWFWTVTFVPAYLVMIPKSKLAGFGRPKDRADRAKGGGYLGMVGRFTKRRARLILLGTVAVAAFAAFGISKIRINDNPTRWFEKDHPIRIADRVLNQHFGGTYDAFLSFEYAPPDYDAAGYAQRLKTRTGERTAAVHAAAAGLAELAAKQTAPDPVDRVDALDRLDALDQAARTRAKSAADPHERAAWSAMNSFLGEALDAAEEGAPPTDVGAAARRSADDIAAALNKLDAQIDAVAATSPASAPEFLEALAGATEGLGEAAETLVAEAEQLDHVFKRPEVLAYLERLQAEMLRTGLVGKSNSLADIVKTVHRDLISGEQVDYRIPDNEQIVAQTLVQYQSSHRKDDLWHFVTPDYQRAIVWLQLKSGDNQDMEAVVAAAKQFVDANPPPVELSRDGWFGLTYINVVWQQKMVTGMLTAFLGSFAVVLIMMVVLFRSVLWGLLSMVPLTVTVALIYGVAGLVGKDYDMPVAVLSSLSLGLAIDYAIHFLARSRQLYELHGSWDRALAAVFDEPARAITRNVVIVGVGFLPLVLAPLVPYQTVGILIAAILLTAGAASLLILPATLTVLRRWMFPEGAKS